MPAEGHGNAKRFRKKLKIYLTLGMLSRLQKHLTHNLPFLKGKKLLLAVSGGIDSIVLTELFRVLEYDIAVAHCNFNLRGKESDADEEFVRTYASYNNILFFVTRFNTTLFASENKLSVQVAARQLRYMWFDELLQENKFDYLLTAHHLDDSLETFLINFTRGTGIEGLTGIPQQNEKIIRPLLPFTREDIESYAKEKSIMWREDSSNTSDKYLRNKLRHHVLPVLKELNSSFAQSFQNTLTHLQQVKSLAEDASVLVYKQVVTEEHSRKLISIPQLMRLPNYKAYLYQWLSPLGFSAWKDIYSLVNAQPGKQVFSSSYRLLKDREVLILEPVDVAETNDYKIEYGVTEVHEPIHLRFIKTDVIGAGASNVIYADIQKLKFPLVVRKWQEGDYFYPSGMKGQKKKVSKYFKDEKMSLSDKENTWLLCSDNQVVWIISKRADERFKTDKNTTQIFKIEVL